MCGYRVRPVLAVVNHRAPDGEWNPVFAAEADEEAVTDAGSENEEEAVDNGGLEEDEPEEEDTPEEEQEIVVPNTGAETGASEATKASLIGCISVGIILSLAVVMPNYKKIQKHLKK